MWKYHLFTIFTNKKESAKRQNALKQQGYDLFVTHKHRKTIKNLDKKSYIYKYIDVQKSWTFPPSKSKFIH